MSLSPGWQWHCWTSLTLEELEVPSSARCWSCGAGFRWPGVSIVPEVRVFQCLRSGFDSRTETGAGRGARRSWKWTGAGCDSDQGQWSGCLNGWTSHWEGPPGGWNQEEGVKETPEVIVMKLFMFVTDEEVKISEIVNLRRSLEAFIRFTSLGQYETGLDCPLGCTWTFCHAHIHTPLNLFHTT